MVLESNGGLLPDPLENEPQHMEIDEEAAKVAFEEKTNDFTLVVPKSPTKAARARSAAAAEGSVKTKTSFTITESENNNNEKTTAKARNTSTKAKTEARTGANEEDKNKEQKLWIAIKVNWNGLTILFNSSIAKHTIIAEALKDNEEMM